MDSINYRSCAACKHSRSRCRPDCILRPYFPADQSTDFENVLRLFTTSKLKKLLQLTPDKDPPLRQEMVKSIKFEAAARARFPVHGTLIYCITLLYQIKLLEDELLCVTNEIVSAKNAAFFRDDGGNSFDDFNYSSQMRPLERTFPVSNNLNVNISPATGNANDNANNNENTIDLFADSRLYSQDIFQSILDLEDDEDTLL